MKFIQSIASWTGQFKRTSLTIAAAVMIGVSNVIYEEQRMVGDSATRIEIIQEESDDDPNNKPPHKLEWLSESD